MRYFIGISCEEYTYQSDISYCHSDLLLLSDTLRDYCDYEVNNIVYELLYRGSEKNEPEYWYRKIEEIVEKATKEDTILFYFAGHGMGTSSDAFFLLSDSKPGEEKDTAISLHRIKEMLNKARCSTFLILDACHSGVYVRDYHAFGIETTSIDKSWATLASCSEHESSFPDTSIEQGIFTFCVSCAIKNWEKKKEITIEGLKIAVADSMEKWCKENGKKQHPTLNGSVVGIQSLAIRNDKKLASEIVISEKQGVKNMNTDIATKKINTPVLWTPSSGVSLPKSAEIETVLSYNAQLKDNDITRVIKYYTDEDYETASEYLWERTIIILRNRVLSFGVEFVGEMVGLNNNAYIMNLPAFEVINLASELGFIDSTGKMRLSQADEIVQHYREQDAKEEMPKNESDTVIRACIQYILSIETTGASMEFGNFRDSLKHELFEKQPDRLVLLEGSPYFYKRTTVRALINLLATTEGAEYETVALNFCKIIEIVWEDLSSDDKYFIGITYSQYVSSGKENQILTFKSALQRVHGFDYVPENLRSISFIKEAKNIKRVHHEINNFYNEPNAVRRLEILGTTIPRPALKETISACIVVYLGNAYGTSTDAIPYVVKVFDKVNKDAWRYYINECFAFDEDVMEKISCGDRRTIRWCNLVKQYNLNELEIRDNYVKELIVKSIDNNVQKAKTIAMSICKKNTLQ